MTCSTIESWLLSRWTSVPPAVRDSAQPETGTYWSTVADLKFKFNMHSLVRQHVIYIYIRHSRAWLSRRLAHLQNNDKHTNYSLSFRVGSPWSGGSNYWQVSDQRISDVVCNENLTCSGSWWLYVLLGVVLVALWVVLLDVTQQTATIHKWCATQCALLRG